MGGSARNSPLAAAVLLGVLILPALGDGCPDDPDTDLCDTTDGCPDDPDTDLCDTTDGCPEDPDVDLCDTTTPIVTTMTTTTPIVTTTPMVPMCADDDALAVELAQNAGFTIGGCADVQRFCENAMYGSTVQATCPETCGLCCADDDALAVELAQNEGFTIGGCADVQRFCENAMYGSTVQATCPATCDSCTRRLADGKDLNAGGLDGIEELTVVAPGTHAAASEVRQKIEESSSSDTNFLIP